jgi:hypothetical protein
MPRPGLLLQWRRLLPHLLLCAQMACRTLPSAKFSCLPSEVTHQIACVIDSLSLSVCVWSHCAGAHHTMKVEKAAGDAGDFVPTNAIPAAGRGNRYFLFASTRRCMQLKRFCLLIEVRTARLGSILLPINCIGLWHANTNRSKCVTPPIALPVLSPLSLSQLTRFFNCINCVALLTAFRRSIRGTCA